MFDIHGLHDRYWIILYYNESAEMYDIDIARILGISYKKYIDILFDCGAYKFGNKYDDDSDTFFDTKEDAEKAIEHLEPHLLMKKLGGDK